jgi:DNA-binding HxlR family transcriptional regulator
VQYLAFATPSEGSPLTATRNREPDMSDLPPVCSRYHRAVELLGRRWAGAIIQVLMAGRARYAAIRGAIPEISDRMLSERLRELEAEGLVERHVATDAPVRVEYELTEKGRALEKSLLAISEWAQRYIPADEEPDAAAGGS